MVGALVARELCRYEAEVLLFERAPDVGWGVTKANSRIVHGGFHDLPGTLRARLGALGNAFYPPELSRELVFPFRRIGAYVLARHQADLGVLSHLLAQGEGNGVAGLQIHPRDELLAREPQVSPQVMAGLWAPTVGITEPWTVALAAVENACVNGLELHLSEEVIGVDVRKGVFQGVATHQRRYPVDAVVNASELFAYRIAAMAGLSQPRLSPRRGEYILLDKAASGLVRSVLFPTSSRESKGILVLPTVDGGGLLGHTPEALAEWAKEATETTPGELCAVMEGARKLVPNLNRALAIKTLAGLRPESRENDFVVGESVLRGFYQAAAMLSPGPTAAPALARSLALQLATGLGLPKKICFQPVRKEIPCTAELSDEDWKDLIREDPRFGRIVCHCNRVTEGEIVAAIRRGARSLDGVKFRTRAGFGRFQGASCTDLIINIIVGELGVTPEEVSLRNERSPIVVGQARP